VAGAETEQAVEVEVRIAASPETVFDFLVEPGKMIQWMGRSAILEPRPGGTFRCDMNGSDIARGEFVEVEPPRRVVFTWGWEAGGSPIPPGSSTVEVLLEPDGDGTILRLVHTDLPGAEEVRRHRAGWEQFVPRLAEIFETQGN
jgi:uncharacterized protein YndB with AHSA1/START domain